MNRRVLLSLIALFIVSTGRVSAQYNPEVITDQNRTGDLPFSATIGTDIEHVDLATGNLVVKIPIVGLKGRGLPYDFMFHYNANFWAFGCSVDINGNYFCQWGIENRPYVNGTVGWEFNVSTLLSPTTTQFKCGTANEFYQDHYMYEDATGGKHLLAIQTTSDPGCSGSDLQGPGLDAQGTWMDQTKSLIYEADGTQLAGTPINPRDANGNQAGEGVGAVDTLGRTIVSMQTGTHQYTYTVHDSSGNQQNYMVNLTLSVPVCTHFGFTGIQESCTTQAGYAMSSLVLPNGQRYQFKYDNYEELTEIDLPTGAVITYTWKTVGTAGPPPHWVNNAHRVVATRTVSIPGQSPQTWSFGGNVGFGGGTITDPLGNQSVYTSSMGTILNAAFYNGPATGNPVRQYKMDYVNGGCPFPLVGHGSPCGDPNIGNQLIRVTTTLDNGQVSKREFDHDTFTYQYHTTPGLNLSTGQPWPPVTYTTYRPNVTEIRDYDYGTVPSTYGSGTPGALLRKIDKTYLHDPISNPSGYQNYLTRNIVDKVLQSTTYDEPSGNQMAQMQWEYDSYVSGVNGLIGTSGVPQHDYTNYPSTFTYRGNVTRVKRWRNTDSQFLTTIYTYDDLGNIRAVTDPLTHTTTYDYTDSWSGGGCLPPSNSQAYVTKVTNPLSQQIKVTYFPCTGLLQAQQDQNDINATRTGTLYSYDLLGRRIEQDDTHLTGDSTWGKTSICWSDTPGMSCYSASLPVTSTTTTAITSFLNKTSVATLDGLGRVIETQLTSDPDGTTEVDTAYDALGRKSTVSNPYRPGNSQPTDGTTAYSYDPLSRVKSVNEPDHSIVLTNYSGPCTTATDEAGKARTSCVDGLGRMTGVWEDPGTAPHLNYETDYTYDVLGNLLTVNQEGGTTDPAQWRPRTFSYNSLSQLLSASNPEMGGLISYTYDSDGNVLSKTSPQANQSSPLVLTTISYCYDTLNRLTSKWYTAPTCSQSSPVANYLYDQTSYNGLAIANGIGRRTGMNDSSGTTAWTFDPLGRALTERRTINSHTQSVGYTYNLDGSPATLTYPSGRVITYTPSTAGRTLSAVDTANGINYVTAATYAPQGALYEFSNGSSVSAAITYNSRLQPLQLYFTTGTISTNTLTQLKQAACPTTTATIMSRSYNFGLGTNDNGNVQSITNCRDTNRTQNFTYDALNRIQTAYTSGPNWGESYGSTVAPGGVPSTPGIDAWGNLWQRSPITGKTYSESLNAPANINNQLTGYGYDAAGNMTANGSTSYTYDAENRVSNTAGYTYTYDGDGKRVEKAAGSTGTLYWTGTGSDTLSESNLSGTMQEEYVFFDGKRVARRDVSGGAVHYYFADHLGSASVIASSAGVVQEESDYYPYGGEIVVSGSDPNHYKFTGKERDQESGLDNFGARYNASSLGRFMSVDPSRISVNSTNPQTWNRYTYALNNPLALVDRNGLWPTRIHNEMIEAVFGGVLSAHQVSLLESVSSGQDSILGGGQSPRNANTHAQCSPGQGASACSAGIKNYIDSNLQMAKQIGDENGLADSALTYYMKAGHSLMDMGSPTHTAADGTPTTWPGLGPTHWFDDLTHIMGEHDEAQDWYGIGRSVRLMVAAFFQAFPEEATQKLGTINGATQRAVEGIVGQYYAGPDQSGQNAIREDAARQCALGNRAACD